MSCQKVSPINCKENHVVVKRLCMGIDWYLQHVPWSRNFRGNDIERMYA